MYIFEDSISGRRFETKSLIELHEYIKDNYPKFHDTVSKNIKTAYMKELDEEICKLEYEAKCRIKKATEYLALPWYKKLLMTLK